MLLNRAPQINLPFSLEDLKTHCRVDIDYIGDDNILEMYAWAAIGHGEFMSNRVWIDGSWKGILNVFPSGEITIPKTPCVSIQKITYIDSKGDIQNFTDYIFYPSSIVPGSGSSYASISPVTEWPLNASKVEISFNAGWPIDSFPQDLMQWIFVKVSSYYEQREDLASATRKIAIEFPRHFVDSLLDKYYLPRY